MSELLIETPFQLDNIDWHDLNDIEKNKQQFKIFNSNKYKKLVEKLTNHASVYKVGSEYFCLDNEFKAITYYMKYEVGNNGKLGSYVWQSLVWTEPSAEYIKHFPEKIFFNDLLTKFGTILTDSEQTWDGRRFWKHRIVESFDKQLNVYFYDFSNHNLIQIEDNSHFRMTELVHDIWGNSNKHKMKRMIITNKELPIKTKERT